MYDKVCQIIRPKAELLTADVSDIIRDSALVILAMLGINVPRLFWEFEAQKNCKINDDENDTNRIKIYWYNFMYGGLVEGIFPIFFLFFTIAFFALKVKLYE